MTGVRRRLLDVGKKVSGALGVPLFEGEPGGPDSAGPAGSEPAATPGASEPASPRSTSNDPELSVTTSTADRETLDATLAQAVDTARAAAGLEAGDSVGEHLRAESGPAADGHLLTHSFATLDPAYVGWRWAVTLSRAEGDDTVTVDEVVLLPGAGALLAPAWVPWSDRIAPGDLSPGDLMPPAPDDVRLVPSYADVEAEPLPADLHRELGLGRARVLSRGGRLEAAERWYEGVAGPDTKIAKTAPAQCGSCGFRAPMAGALGTVFGVCANVFAVDDGRVVALTHGCGAHSETVLEAPPDSLYAGMAVEDEDFELVETPPLVSADDSAAAGPGNATAAGSDKGAAGPAPDPVVELSVID